MVEYFENERNVLLHVGSAKNDEELLSLKKSALNWIEKNDRQKSLFPLVKKNEEEKSSCLIPFDKCQYLGFRYQLLYDVFLEIGAEF